MQHSKHKGLYLKRKITASLLSFAIVATGVTPLVSTVVASAATAEDAVGAPTVDIGTDNGKDVFWANATYYDYLSDAELENGWKQNIQAGTGHSGSEDNWYPFYQFNEFISGKAAADNNWTNPLYFGNFYNGDDKPYENSTHGGNYDNATKDLSKFSHGPNNSEKKYDGTGLADEHESYQGLVQSTLKNGKLMVSDSTPAPYFDESALGSYAKVFKSAFPFTQEEHIDYTKYSFKSSTNDNQTAADNVYFTYDGSGNPTAVNYSEGTSHAVKDGKRYFMYGDSSGYGIFPFNEPGTDYSGVKNGYLYVSVRNTVEWNLGVGRDPYVYWNDNRVQWPGTVMEWVRDEDDGDNKVYKVKIPDGLASGTGFVISNGDGGNANQTVDGSYDLLKKGGVFVDTSFENGKHKIGDWGSYPADAGIVEYTTGTEKLDYGFGIRMDVKFRVPKEHLASDGVTVVPAGKSEDGSTIRFDFAGDDDLWMFITDNETGESQLVLDMGGNHKKSAGHVYFDTCTAVVDNVYENTSSTTHFDFDYSHTYTMTVFYMERGLIESNCDMSFTMVPLGNNFIVTEKINTTNVNPGLVDDVTALDEFTFTPSQNGTTTWENGLNYSMDGGADMKKTGQNSVNLGSGHAFSIANFFNINDSLGVTQTRTDSVLKYSTDYVYTNNTTGKQLDKGSKADSVETVATKTGYLSNDGTDAGDRFEFAELQADFVNTPKVVDLELTKEDVDFLLDRLATGDKGQADEFDVKVGIDFGGKNGPYYDFSYISSDQGSKKANKGVLKIKDGREITIPDVPVGSTITLSETLTDNFKSNSFSENGFVLDENSESVKITNVRKDPTDVKATINIDKAIVVDGHNTVNGANLKEGYTFLLKLGDDVIDTKTITSDTDKGSATFKELTFTVDESKKGQVSQGVIYIDPSSFKNNGTKTFEFTVSEQAKEGDKLIDYPANQSTTFTISYDKKNNVLTTDKVDNTDTREFVNPVNTGSVSITKKIVNQDNEPVDETKEFSATVSFAFEGKTFDAVPFYYIDGDKAAVEKLGTSQTITLKHNKTVTFMGLPVGTEVTVSEAKDDEYVATYSPSQSVTIGESGQELSIEVTNTRQKPGSATVGVKKILENADVAAKAGVTIANAGFKFNLKENGGTYDETITATSATANFPAIDFESATTRTFTLTESVPENKDENIVYNKDSVSYTVEVTATKDDATNTVNVTKIVYKDQTGATVYSVNGSSVDVNAANFPTFTNEYKKGFVEFDKQVIGADGNPIDDASEFTVHAEITYPNGNTEEQDITIKNGETKQIADLPLGTEVKLTETKTNNYIVYYSTADGNAPTLAAAEATTATGDYISDGSGVPQPGMPAGVTIFNQKVDLTAQLKAKKTLVGKELKAGDFTFTLTGDGVSQSKTNDKDGNVTFDPISYKVRQGETGAISPDAFKDGVYTATYTITETKVDSNNIKYDGSTYTATVTIKKQTNEDGIDVYTVQPVTYSKNGTAAAAAEFTNEYKLGNVKVVKEVKDSDGAAYDTTGLSFDIDVTFTYPSDYTGTKQANTTLTLNSANSFSGEFKNLPVGTVVKIEEKDTKGFSVSYDPQEVTVKDGETLTLKAVNTRQAPGSTSFPVSFVKGLEYYDLAENEFTFTLNGSGYAENAQQTNTASGVIDFGTVTVKYAKTATAADTDTHTVYLTDADFNADGIATLTYTAKEVIGTDGSIIYDGGTIVKTVQIKKTVTATQTTLSVESNTDVKTVDGAAVDGDAKFINRKVGPVSITKVTKKIDESGTAVDYDTDETFTVNVSFKLPGTDAFAVYPYMYTTNKGASATPLGDDGKIQIRNGVVVTFDGLPYGTEMKVTEDSNPKYTVSYSSETATVGGEISLVTVTNTLQAPNQAVLPVTKNFTENAVKAGVNKNASYEFRMVADSSNKAGLGTYDEKITLTYDKDGNLISGNTFPAIKFPADFDYTAAGTDFRYVVTETLMTGNIITDTHGFEVIYTVKSDGTGLDVSAPKITKYEYNGTTYVNGAAADSVSFTNDYAVGKVEIKKAVKDFDGADLAAYADETFPVKATVTYPNGTVETVTGTISVSKSFTIDKLPYGTTVKVEETDSKGMTSKVEPETVTVSAQTPAPVVMVTNTRTTLNPTEIQIPAVKGIAGSDIKDHEGEFVFKLTGNGIDLSATNDKDGKVLFDKINFRVKKSADDVAEANTILIDKDAFSAGNTVSFVFTVAEVKGARDDMRYDENTYNVIVQVTKTETLSEISLEAAITSGDAPVFHNTQLGRVKLTKTALDVDGKEFKPDADFKFKATAQTLSDWSDENIVINLSKDETATYTTPYLPVGTVVTFEETDTAGFDNATKTQNVTVIEEKDEMATVSFTNVRPTPGETKVGLAATKVAEGYKLSKDDFSFTAKGRGIDETVKNAADGKVAFSEITYKYTKGTETDDNDNHIVYLHDGDFTDGKAVITYTINEIKGDNTDVIYDEKTVTATVTITKTETASSITLDNAVAYTDNATFTNPLRKGSVEIIKKNQNGDLVDDVTFTVFKVTGNGLSREDVIANGVKVDSKKTVNGEVKFGDLDLYVDGTQTLANPERQWYCFAETDPGDGYNLNSELTFFQLPTEKVYDVQFSYMNGKITTPESGAHGTFAFKLAGSVILAMASLALAAYLLFVRKSSTKYARKSK